MQRGADGAWRASLEAPQGALFQYRYSRNGDWDAEESFVPLDGHGFPHRELVLTSSSLTVTDSIAKWEDLPLVGASVAQVRGIVTDDATGLPLHDIIVSGGPYQTRTLADGSYRLLGVPQGETLLTFRATDGAYRAETMVVTVRDATTQDNALSAASMRDIELRVALPAETPAEAVPRLLGDTAELGMFTNDDGSAFTTTTSRPFELADGGWTLALHLGEGHAFRYVLTLGDDTTNVERSSRGEPLVRALVVGPGGTLAQNVGTWRAPGASAIRLHVTVPTDDEVAFTTTRWDGGAPITMWPGPEARAWTYTWYAAPWEDLRYRYVRAGDSQIGVERLSPDGLTTWRSATPGAPSDDVVSSWRHQLRETILTYTPNTASIPRPTAFDAGIELIDYWRPAWAPLVGPATQRARDDGAGSVQVARTWRMAGLQTSAPFVDDGGMNGMPLREVIAHIDAAHAQGVRFALRSSPFPVIFADQDAIDDPHDAAWIDTFFDEMQRAFVEDARIAEAHDVDLFILTNPDMGSSVDNVLAARIDARWRGVIAAVRAAYSGPVTTDHFAEHAAYGWYADLDFVGAKFWDSVATSDSDGEAKMEAQATNVLNTRYKPLSERFGRPVFFAEVAFASVDGGAQQRYGVYAREIDDFQPEIASVASDHAEQADAMEATLRAMASASWVQGAHIFGTSYFELDSKGFSITGKAAERAVSSVFEQLS
jgi:hypothetical protein